MMQSRNAVETSTNRLLSYVFWLGCLVVMAMTSENAWAHTAAANGIELKSEASALFGAPSGCTKPATVDYKRLRNATSEWREIKSQGVRKGSGRYSLLISAIDTKVRKACEKVAKQLGFDCIVRHGEIKNARGLEVADLTRKVSAAMG